MFLLSKIFFGLFQELEVINNAQAILKRAIRECETQIKCVLIDRTNNIRFTMFCSVFATVQLNFRRGHAFWGR